MIIAGNWKMNLLLEPAKVLAQAVASHSEKLVKTASWLAPTLTALPAVAPFQGARLRVGAQNVHWTDSGAFTGEISAPMLKELDCSFAIIGHSERRQYFGESDETVQKRAAHALGHGLDVIVCIGETLEQRESGNTQAVLESQLKGCLLKEWDNSERELLIAYEPVWAIGTGKVATTSEIEAAHNFILTKLNEIGFTRHIPLLYGGSVKPENFEEIAAIEEVHGALVGGASLHPESFIQLLDIAEAS
jgi:triosephosphate isomerase